MACVMHYYALYIIHCIANSKDMMRYEIYIVVYILYNILISAVDFAVRVLMYKE